METPDILKDRRTQTAIISVVSAAGGAIVGYIFAKRRFFKRYELVVVEQEPVETQLALDFDKDNSLEKVGITVDGVEMKPIGDEITSILLGKDDEDETSPPEKIRVNVFTIEDEDWDYEVEMANRNPNEPYIIHAEEFIADEMDFRQSTITYYAKDDIMADELETPIYGYHAMMGELKFGHGSKDKNVVYIRNEKMEMEWEVLLHQGSYLEEVRGFEMEQAAEESLHHSVLKFRRD